MRLTLALVSGLIVAGLLPAVTPASDVIRPVRRVRVEWPGPDLGDRRVPLHEGLSVDAPTRDDVFLATAAGLLASHDVGRHWRLVSTWRLGALDFVTPRLGFALSDCSCPDRLLRTQDGGRTWILIRRFQRFDGYDSSGAGLDFVDGRHGWLWRNRLYQTGDGGLSWSVLRFRCAHGWWLAGVTFRDRRHGYATCSIANQSFGEDVRVYASSDAGLHWRCVRLQDAGADARMVEHARQSGLRVLNRNGSWGFGLGSTTTWATDRRGYGLHHSVLTRTSDGGATWARIRPRPQPVDGEFAFVSGRRGVWAYFRRILATDDGGRTWWPRASRPRNLWDVTTIRGGGLAGWGGVGRGRTLRGTRFFRSLDGGRTWNWRGFLPRIRIMKLAIASPRRWFAIGQAGQLFRSGDAGHTWLPVGGHVRLGSAAFFTPGLGYGVTKRQYGMPRRGRLLRTTDGGDHWTEVRIDLGPERPPIVSNVAVADRRHGWVSTPFALLRTSDRGRTWTLFDGVGASEGESLVFATPRLGFVYGQSSLYRTRDGGRHWRLISGQVDENAVF